MNQEEQPFVSLHLTPARSQGHGSWLRYFAAALCIGVAQGQEQVLLDYWWVYNDTPSPEADAVQILRVTGEKGEKYEEVVQPSDYKLMADSAHSLIGRSMRGEVVALASQYISEGMSSPAAYEKAWTTVYRRRVLSAESKEERARMEELVNRIVRAENLDAFTPGELLLAMHALMADEKRQETEEGRQLLEKIANRLRSMGYTKDLQALCANDEVMALFIDALQHNMNAFAAYRDALFKANRDKIMHHDLVGYRAPWGAGMGGRVRYRQAPKKESLTIGSGNQPAAGNAPSGASAGQPAGLQPANGAGNVSPGLSVIQTSGAVNPFLATAPEDSGITSEEEALQEEEEKKKTQEPDTTYTYTKAYAGPEPSSGSSRAMTFGLSRLMMLTAAADETADIDVEGAAALYFTSATEVTDRTQVQRGSWWQGNSYSVVTYGSYKGTLNWGTDYGSYWYGDGKVSRPSSSIFGGGTSTDTSTNWINKDGKKTIDLIDLGADDKLYIGGTAHYTGRIRVNDGNDQTFLGSYLPQGGLLQLGKLTGNGTLTLLAHGEPGEASIYTFNDAADDVTWFSGTLKLGASQGGIMQLELGRSGETQAWSNVEFDMNLHAGPGHTTTTGKGASMTILNIRNNVTIAGLTAENGNGTVTSESGDNSYNLTLGWDGKNFEYGGTFNGDYYGDSSTLKTSTAPLNLIKEGTNTQFFTQDSGTNAFNIVTVNAGTLALDSDADQTNGADCELRARYVYVNEGGTLNAGSLAVTGTQENAPEFFVQGGKVNVAGEINVTYEAGISAGAQVNAGSMRVGNILAVDGVGSSLTVSGNATDGTAVRAAAVQVTNGGHLNVQNQAVQITGGLDIGTRHSYDAEAARSLVTVGGTLTAGGLRLRADGSLETSGATSFTGDAYLYGGAEWQMTGGNNVLQGDLLKLVNVNDSQVSLSGSDGAVLTLPGIISFADAGVTSSSQAVFNLDGVMLDFHTGVTITNLGYTVAAGDTITLATTSGNGGSFVASLPNVTVQSGMDFYHGLLSKDATTGNILITIEHKIDFSENPFTVGASDVVYIEMYQDASHPALPYLAYDDAVYQNGSWKDENEKVGEMELMRFSNVQLTEGGHLYMGEDKTLEDGVDYRKDRQFGGNIQIIDNGSNTAYLHGQLNNWGKWALGGRLSGSGSLKLVSHNNAASAAPTPTSTTTTETKGDIETTIKTDTSTTVHGVASTFTFTDTGSALKSEKDFFDGTLSIDDYNGGIVQLNLGNVNVAGNGDIRFRNTLIDLTPATKNDPANGVTTGTSNATLVLGIQGDTTVRGLRGDANASVVSALRADSSLPSTMLTVGDSTNDNYDFKGTVGAGQFYTGGEASTTTTTITTTVRDTLTNISSTTENTITAENNFFTTRTGSLSLTKVGTNTQAFSSNQVHLDKVVAQEGTLVFSGTADINELTVHNGARVDAHTLTLDIANLYGGAKWYAGVQNPDSYDTQVRIWDIFGEDGVTAITIGSTYETGGGNPQVGSTWKPAMNLDMANAGTWTENSGAIFHLENVTLDLNSPRIIANMAGITAGSRIAMYSGVSESYDFQDNMVMVQDANGMFYDADYVLQKGVIYLQLANKPINYGIVINEQTADAHKDKFGYIWSGENNGFTVNDVHYINMTMGNVWRADGSAYNTGWHEQRAVGSANTDTGVYVNGNTVYFLDTNVHDESETQRLVDISGKVAPGTIIVDADDSLGHVGKDTFEGQMWYGYAFVSTDGSGSIIDFGDTPTYITKKGDALLVLNTANSFTGGIDVQDGGLYLAAPGAAGTGTLSFHTDQTWDLMMTGESKRTSSPVTVERLGAELMICYPHSNEDASAFRSSALNNDIVLTSSSDGDVEGSFKVSFAYSSFNSKGADNEDVPRHWRNLTMSGALIGTGHTDANGNWVNTSANDVLELTGYSSTWGNVRDQSYTTVLTLNEDTADKSLYEAANYQNRFAGKVVLTNTVNTSPLPTNDIDNRIAGTVQVVLKGEKLSQAELDMTRESVTRFTVYDTSGNAVTHIESTPRQTYNNILLLNGDAQLRGLSAKFVGSGYYYYDGNLRDDVTQDSNEGKFERAYKADMEQVDEVWHVRTLTAGLTNLQLGERQDTKDTATYIYSGAMGFAQAYAGNAEAHVPWGDGFFQHTDEWYFGGHSMAKSNLSLTKNGVNSTQYIHTALLQDLYVYEGKLGFNNLQLQGNLNLQGGSQLQLGVSGTIGAGLNAQDWDETYNAGNTISGYEHHYATSDTVTVAAGKTLTVITPKTTGANGLPLAAEVDGDILMSKDSTLTFVVNGVVPAADDTTVETDNGNYQYPLLDVAGTFTLEDNTGITINFNGVDFSTQDFANKTYYLAAANDIVIGSQGDSSSFTSRVISLGYGYFGWLDTLDSSTKTSPDTRDYLVMTVSGDPRRTWFGKETGNYIWKTATEAEAAGFDYRWKENRAFRNGQVVLFGNLYTPDEWTEGDWLGAANSSEKTVMVQGDANAGTTIAAGEAYNGKAFNIDSYTAAVVGFQKVQVEGDVAPAAVIINADYKHKQNEDDPFSDKTDGTDYYFFGDGRIVDADSSDYGGYFDGDWKTMLNKTGEGTVVINLDNRYTGGSVLQGGRVVMQHVNALGYVYNPDAGEDESPLTGNAATIVLMNGAALQGDFADIDFPGNHDDAAATSQGGFMQTTTIRNKVVVNVFADPTDPSYDAKVDGILINSHDKKLVLATLEGETDTVLELCGVGVPVGDAAKTSTGHYVRDAAGNYLDAEGNIATDGKFHYGVFKVLDPSKFYGTVTMSGYEWGKAASSPGRVQLDIMSTAKSDAGADWTNATVDLTVNEGTERTVVALDVMSSGEVCKLNSINGMILEEGGSSSVLNMSKYNTATLELTGTRNGHYHGVLGYGDFQVAVDYGGYTAAEHYTTQHHYGAENHGALNLIKYGEKTTQIVRRAWLHDLTVAEGVFSVEEALVAYDITAGGGDYVTVGEVKGDTLYSLTVGAGGTLAMNTKFAEAGRKKDAWANIDAGSTAGDTTTKAAWVQLRDGATLSAREDWYTRKQVDIATGANVTINTHNFAIDPYITAENDVFGKYTHSHIIQLLGKMVGRDVHLTINNQLTDPSNKDADIGSSDDSLYMGYAALNDLNDFEGESSVIVKGMTVLQILGDNGGVEADLNVRVAGKNATLQILDKVTTYGSDNTATLSDTMVQYIDELTLGANTIVPKEEDGPTDGYNDPLTRVNNGQLMLGGTEVTTLVPDNDTPISTPKTADMQVLISSRHNSLELEGKVSHLHVDMRGNSVKLGGAEGHRAEMLNTHIDMTDVTGARINHVLHHTDLRNSLVHLHEDCSLNISEAVLVDYSSEIQGVKVDYQAGTVDPTVGPAAAVGLNDTVMTKEVTTSTQTLVQMTFDEGKRQTYAVGSGSVMVLQTDQFTSVDVTGKGLTIELHEDWNVWATPGTNYVAVQMGGGSGQFLYEVDNATADSSFGKLIGSQFVLRDKDGNNLSSLWVTSTEVSAALGEKVSEHMLYFTILVPEPTTATLSLLALTALLARRRRK